MKIQAKKTRGNSLIHFLFPWKCRWPSSSVTFREKLYIYKVEGARKDRILSPPTNVYLRRLHMYA